MFGDLLLQFSALVGFAALVSVIINVLKIFNVVKDGTADKWVASINLVGLTAFVAAKMFIPDFDVIPVDTQLGQLANVATYLISYITMLLGSKLTYVATKGLPIIGKSNSEPVG